MARKADDDAFARRLAALKAARPLALELPAARADGRREPRVNTYRFGRITLADRSEQKCIIRDMSRNGVRVVLEGGVVLSERVILRIDHTGERRRARVAWQRDREAGLSFTVEPPFRRKFRKQVNGSRT